MHLARGLALCLLVCACNEPPAAPPAPPPPTSAAPATATTPAEPIADYVVEVFADSKGVLWFGTIGKGVARRDGDTLTYLNPTGGGGDGDTVVSIAEDRQGNLWFAGHAGTGLSRYDGETFTKLWDDETHVSADRHGNIWASTRDIVYRHDGTTFTEFHVPLGDHPARAYTIGPGRAAMVLEDSRGHLWFRTDGHGALRHDGAAFTRYTKRDGLCSDTVWSIAEDPQGRLWFGCVQAFQPTATGDGGVRRWDGTAFTAFPEHAGLVGHDVYTLHTDRAGAVWIGATGVGVYRYKDDTFTLYTATDRPDLNGRFGLQAMMDDRRGVHWFGFSGGLFRLDGDRFVHVPQTGPWP